MSNRMPADRRKSLIQIACLVVASTKTVTTQAGIYRWTDRDGNVHFSDIPSTKHSSESVEVRINSYESVKLEQSTVDTGKTVVMYSASWCGVCKVARRHFKQNGIKFTEYDIEKSRKGRSEFRKLKARGVPVILVGKKRLNGFSVAGFKRLYS